MKRVVMVFVAALICQIFMISSFVLASQPAKYKSEGCVVGGKVFNLFQGKKQYTFDLPKGFNLSPYEGKKVMLEGDIYPGDYFVPKNNTLQILGPCTQSSDINASWPAKPANPKPPTKQPPPPTVKPTPQPQQPVQVQTKPAASSPTPKQPLAQPQPQPAQPTAAAPAPRPGQQPQNPANCRQNCQSQYDAKIRNCAGYNIGNSAPACKDPITREKDSCLKSCR